MTPQQIAEAARALDEAEQSRQQIGLLSVAYPDITLDEAYAVQAALVARKQARGLKAIGWKIGLTSKAMQAALQIDVPDSGILLDDMLFEDGAMIPQGHFIQPRVEAEIAFIMGQDLVGEIITAEQVWQATDYVAPALEILDTRVLRQDPTTKTPRKIFDTVADNAANAGLVLGRQRHKPEAIDLRWVGAIVLRNEVVEETGLGAGVLNDPATSVAWLAMRLAHYGGQIAAGDIILSGSFIRPIEAPPASDFYADFGTFGAVRCRFA